MSKNSLAEFSKAVLDEAKAQQQRLIDGLEERRNNEIADIKNELATQNSAQINSEKKRMEEKSRANVSAAHAKAFESLIHTREQIFNEIFESVTDKIQDYIKTEEYRDFLRTSLAEVMKRISKGTTVCEVCEADFEFMNTLSKQYSNMEIVRSKSEFIGGFILKNSDMRLYADNTLSRLIELEKEKFYKRQELMIEF